jgi:hypothetical protein
MKNTYHRAHGNARTFLRLRDKEEACTPITGGLQTVDYRKTTSALLSDQAPKITPPGAMANSLSPFIMAFRRRSPN